MCVEPWNFVLGFECLLVACWVLVSPIWLQRMFLEWASSACTKQQLKWYEISYIAK